MLAGGTFMKHFRLCWCTKFLQCELVEPYIVTIVVSRNVRDCFCTILLIYVTIFR